MSRDIIPTNVEVTFDPKEFIVSKTDTKGKITYCNQIFCEVAGYSFNELIGQPHSIIRHPDMPRVVFETLWKQIACGQEVFAYVKNLCKSGAYYWVFAHVTPTFDRQGNIIGYHSTRRSPDSALIQNTIVPFYKQLLDIEQAPKSRKDGLRQSTEFFSNFLAEKRVSYDEFVLTL